MRIYVIMFTLTMTQRRLHFSFPGEDWACGVKFYDCRELRKKEELGGAQEVVAQVIVVGGGQVEVAQVVAVGGAQEQVLYW